MTTRVLLILVFRTDHLLDGRRRVKRQFIHYLNGSVIEAAIESIERQTFHTKVQVPPHA